MTTSWSAPTNSPTVPGPTPDCDCGIDPVDLTLVYLNALSNAGMVLPELSTAAAHDAFEVAVRGCSWPDMWRGGYYHATPVLRRAWKNAATPLACTLLAVLCNRAALSHIDDTVRVWAARHTLSPLPD